MRLFKKHFDSDPKQPITTFQEAAQIGWKFSTELLQKEFILASGSSPHPGMMSEEILTTLVALIQLPVDTVVICETTNSGFAKSYLNLPWGPQNRMHPGEALSAGYFSDETAKSKRRFIVELYEQLRPFLIDQSKNLEVTFRYRLMEKTFADFKLSELVHDTLEEKQIGKVFLPGAEELRQVAGMITNRRGECFNEVDLSTMVREYGFSLNALAAFVIDATKASSTTAIAIRDYSNSRGTFSALQSIWPNQHLFLTTRMYCEVQLEELPALIRKNPQGIARMLQVMPLFSDGSEWYITK